MDYEDDNNYVDFSEQGDSSDFQVDHDEQGWAEQPPEEYDIYGGEGSSTEMSDEELMASAMASVPSSGVPRFSKERTTPEARREVMQEAQQQERLDDTRKAQGDTVRFQGMRESDIFLHKIGNMDYNMQAAFKDVALGKTLSSRSGIDGQSMQVAMNQFTSITGVSGEEFAARIKLDKSVQATRSSHDLNTVNSMLANIAGDLEMGPGAKLTGNIYANDTVKQQKLNDDQAWAYGIIDELVDMTKEGIRGKKGEAGYTERVWETMYKAATESAVGPDSMNWVPLPSELNVYGTVLNMAASSSVTGTKYNRTTFSDAYPDLLTEHGEMGQIMGGDGVMIDSGIVPHTRGMRSDLFAEMQSNRESGNRNSDELNDYLQNSPSLKATYMPKPSGYSEMSIDGQKSWRDERNTSWGEFEANLIRARGILGRQAVTTTDESNGNNVRLSGFDRPYDEQADRMSAINEAQIYGMGDGEITQGQRVDLESLRRATTGGGIEKVHQELVEANNKLGTSAGVGTEKGGMYGDKPMTEMDQFIELSGEGLKPDEILHYLETGERPEDIPTVYADSDRGQYQKLIDTTKPPKQGTDAWLSQRKGNVTASAVDKLNGGKGETQVIQNLALEGMGLPAIGGFKGSATSQAGNDLEEKAKNQFLNHMAKAGTPLDWEEAYFESNPELPGMGVSPDGRLYNEDGSSAGLLEIKVLKKKNMAGALNKYYKQMQMQMAVTGEKVTHFWVKDREGSGDHVIETVYADTDMQEELIGKANNAQRIAGSLSTVEDVEAYRMARIQSKSVRMNKPSHTQGQQDGWIVPQDKNEVLATPWSADWQAEVGLSNDGEKVTGKNSVLASAAKKIAKDENKAQMLDAEEMMLNSEGKTSGRQDKAATKAESAAKKEESDIRAMAMQELKAYAEANKMAASAAKESAEGLAEFKKGVKDGAKVLGEITGLLLGGNESAMDEVRFAAESGEDLGKIRGMREVMEQGHMSEGSINSTLRTSAKWVRAGNDLATGSTAWAGLHSKLATSDSAAVRNIDLGTLEEFRGRGNQEWTAWAANAQQNLSAEDKSIFNDISGFGGLSTFTGEASDIGSAYSTTLNKQDILDVKSGIVKFDQNARIALETAGSTGGENAGLVIATTAAAADIAGSNTSNMLLSATAGAAGAGGGAGATAAATAAMTKLSASATAASLSIGKMAKSAGMVGLAGAAGAAVGTGFSWLVKDTWYGDGLENIMGGGINHVAALLGNEEAQNVRALHNMDMPAKVGSGTNHTDALLVSEEAQNVRSLHNMDMPASPYAKIGGGEGNKTNVDLTVNVDKSGNVTTETKAEGQVYMNNSTSNMTNKGRGGSL